VLLFAFVLLIIPAIIKPVVNPTVNIKQNNINMDINNWNKGFAQELLLIDLDIKLSFCY
jgi:hypothetical protein